MPRIAVPTVSRTPVSIRRPSSLPALWRADGRSCWRLLGRGVPARAGVRRCGARSGEPIGAREPAGAAAAQGSTPGRPVAAAVGRASGVALAAEVLHERRRSVHAGARAVSRPGIAAASRRGPGDGAAAGAGPGEPDRRRAARTVGAGAARAETAARALVADGVDGLVSWGCASALVPALAVGDLLLPREIVTAAGPRLAVDAEWHARLTDRIGGGARLRHGALETRGVLGNAANKQALHALSAIAADRESAAIAAVAVEFGPFIVVRGRRRCRDDGPPVARAALDDDGALRPLRVLRRLVRPPAGRHAELRAIKQLAVAFRTAQRTLDAVAPLLLDTEPDGDT